MKTNNSTFSHSSFAGLIGVARADITPPVGIYSRNWGAAKHDVAIGIHRPLTLTCLTFQSRASEPPLVLIAADLGWWKRVESEWFVRSGVLDALRLDESRLMFCLSHTHAGASVLRDDELKPGGKFIAPYLEKVRAAAIRVAKLALKKRTQATLTWNYGKCDLATNRDLPEAKRKRFVVGFNPARSADDTLLVGRVTNPNGRIMASIVNYACHPTTLAWDNRLISPDYIGAMREVIEARTKAPCAFLQGASGELAPAEQYVGDTSVADAHGRRLGFAALSVLEGMMPAGARLSYAGVVESGAALAVWKRSQSKPSGKLSAAMKLVELPVKPMPPYAEIEEQWRRCTDRVMKERLWRKLGARKIVGDGKVSRRPIWMWRLGDAFLVGHAQEAYSSFQMTLRRQVAPSAVAVMNLVNGSAGYLPPRQLYGKEVYTVWQTPFGKGSLELLTASAANAVNKLK